MAEDQTSSSLYQLEALLDKLHRHKTVGYADAWRKRGELLSIFANVARKYDRLDVALEQHVEGTDERLIDTAADLCVYAAKYLTWLAEEHPESFSEPPAAPPAADCADADGPNAVTTVLGALASWETACGVGSPPTLDEAWSRVKIAFVPLEAALLAQAGAINGQTIGWAHKCRLLWELTHAAAWLTIHVAERHRSQFAEWQAEIDAMDISPT